MKRKVYEKKKNTYSWKWILDFEDWVTLCVFMAIIDILVFIILRG